LFEAAQSNVKKATYHLNAGHVEERCKSISKAMDIILLGLKASVDESQGDVAKSLAHSYDLMVHHLMLANAHAKIEHLTIVLSMLDDIAGAWNMATGQTPS